MITLWKFLQALPAFIQLFKTLQKRIDDAGVDRKVHEDVSAIHEAFHEKDPAKLHALFNS